MKAIIILLFTLLTFLEIRAQQVNLSVCAEKTVAATDYGFGLSYQNKKNWSLGFFGQAAFAKDAYHETSSIKNPFYGIILQAPLVKSDRITFFMNMRGGIVNEKFAVVVPGLETQIRIFSSFSTSIGMSLRHGYPAASLKLITSVF